MKRIEILNYNKKPKILVFTEKPRQSEAEIKTVFNTKGVKLLTVKTFSIDKENFSHLELNLCENYLIAKHQEMRQGYGIDETVWSAFDYNGKQLLRVSSEDKPHEISLEDVKSMADEKMPTMDRDKK